MLHIPTNYSPRQLVESGQRAEADGKFDLAGNLFRHVADSFPETIEAAEARGGLMRMGYAPPEAARGRGGPAGPGAFGPTNPQGLGPYGKGQGPAMAPSGPYVSGQQGPPRGVEPALPRSLRPKLPAPRRGYPFGRLIAGACLVLGWLLVAAGLLSPVPALLGFLGPGVNPISLGMTALFILGGGLFAVLAGLSAAALFDQADAAREMVSIERAKWSAGQG